MTCHAIAKQRTPPANHCQQSCLNLRQHVSLHALQPQQRRDYHSLSQLLNIAYNRHGYANLLRWVDLTLNAIHRSESVEASCVQLAPTNIVDRRDLGGLLVLNWD